MCRKLASHSSQLILLLLCVSLCSCATPSKSRLATTVGSFALGLGVGSASAPKDERNDLHAIYWGGIFGVTAAIAANYYFNEEDSLKVSQLENEKLKAELELIQNANKVLLKEGQGYFKNAAGEEYFQSGKAKWRIYQIDKWSKDGPNRLYHQDRLVELIPQTPMDPR